MRVTSYLNHYFVSDFSFSSSSFFFFNWEQTFVRISTGCGVWHGPRSWALVVAQEETKEGACEAFFFILSEWFTGLQPKSETLLEQSAHSRQSNTMCSPPPNHHPSFLLALSLHLSALFYPTFTFSFSVDTVHDKEHKTVTCVPN